MLIENGDPSTVLPVPRVTVTTTGLSVAADESGAWAAMDAGDETIADIATAANNIAPVAGLTSGDRLPKSPARDSATLQARTRRPGFP